MCEKISNCVALVTASASSLIALVWYYEEPIKQYFETLRKATEKFGDTINEGTRQTFENFNNAAGGAAAGAGSVYFGDRYT